MAFRKILVDNIKAAKNENSMKKRIESVIEKFSGIIRNEIMDLLIDVSNAGVSSIHYEFQLYHKTKRSSEFSSLILDDNTFSNIKSEILNRIFHTPDSPLFNFWYIHDNSRGIFDFVYTIGIDVEEEL